MMNIVYFAADKMEKGNLLSAAEKNNIFFSFVRFKQLLNVLFISKCSGIIRLRYLSVAICNRCHYESHTENKERVLQMDLMYEIGSMQFN